MQFDEHDPTFDPASKMLAEMEAAEDAADKLTPQTQSQSDSATPPARAGQSSNEQVPSTNLPSGGTPATKEPQKPQDQPDKPADKPADGKESRYAKAQKRLTGNWDQYHAAKEAFDKQQESFKRERDALVAERKQLQDDRQKAAQPKYKPEDYENASREWTRQAMALNEQAEKLEGDAKYDEADKAREKSKALRSQALQAKERADYLRANPPQPSPTAEQAAQQFEVKRKEWYGKALQDFPDLAKKDSAVFKRLTATLTQGAEGYDPIISEVVNRSPEGMYYAARLVAAETLAASVAQKEKELVELRAKVKELDEKTAIPSDAVAQQQLAEKPDSEKTDEELEAELKREAAAMDGQRRW